MTPTDDLHRCLQKVQRAHQALARLQARLYTLALPMPIMDAAELMYTVELIMSMLTEEEGGHGSTLA